MNRCRPEHKGHERAWTDATEESSSLKKGEVLDRNAKDGKMREKRDEVQGRSTRGRGNNLKTEVSLHKKKGLWNIKKKRVLEDRGALNNVELKRLVFQQCPFSWFEEGGNFTSDTWAAGVAPSLDSLALMVL